MPRFDSSFQIRAGLRISRAVDEDHPRPERPTNDEIAAEVKAALEARWPDFEATVRAERLDRD